MVQSADILTLVLAGGAGSRFRSAVPKVGH